MERLKNALNLLETAVIRLEDAVHHSKKKYVSASDQIDQLRTVIRTTYNRLDKAVADYKKGGE